MNKKNYQSVPLTKIAADGSTQTRCETSEDVAGEYALALQAGGELPPPVLFWDGHAYWVGDGHHTIRAHEIANIPYITAEIRSGTQRDALLFALGANARHGLRRTNADKRRAVGIMLDDDEWSQWPNTKIANQCAVDEGLVRKVKRERNDNGQCKSSDCPSYDLSDLPADQLAAFQSLPESEQRFLLDAAQADEEMDQDDVVDALRSKFEHHIAELKKRHPLVEDVAGKADKALAHYEGVVFQSAVWAN